MSQPRRVLYVITDSGTGGAEKKLLDILKTVDRSRFQPCGVVVLKKKREMAGEWEQADVPVVAMNLGRWPLPGSASKLKAKIKEFSAEVVHSLTLHSVLLARMARKSSGEFALVSAPCLNFRTMPSYVNWLVRGTGAWDDAAICESTATREFMVNRLQYDPNKAVYIPNSIDAGKFKFDSEARAKIRQEWKIAEDEMLVGTVGRLHAQKGFDVFIDALERLRGFSVRLRGAIVGEGKDLNNLKTKAEGKHLPVLFPGKRDDMIGVLSALDIYVQSSRYEGMSRALMEAMAVGRPAVATSVDGTMDLAQDGENMILCRPDDADSLALGIGTLAEKAELRQKISMHARATAEQFSVEKMVRRLEKLYEEIL